MVASRSLNRRNPSEGGPTLLVRHESRCQFVARQTNCRVSWELALPCRRQRSAGVCLHFALARISGAAIGDSLLLNRYSNQEYPSEGFAFRRFEQAQHLEQQWHAPTVTRMAVANPPRSGKVLALFRFGPILLPSLTTAADQDLARRSKGKGYQMKPAAQSSRGQSGPNRDSGGRPSGAGERAEPRARVLLFACDADDARLMMIYSDRMNLTYLPSHDMEEVQAEIERCKPRLILCGANAFLDALFARSPGASPRPRKNGSRTTAEAGSLPIARREMKLLTMLAKGQTNDEIAKALRLSRRTVKRILSSLFERLQVTNRTQLAGRVAELSLLEDDN